MENIDIDKEILENIDIDQEILENINIDKILNRLEFGISNSARCIKITVTLVYLTRVHDLKDSTQKMKH